MGNKERDGPEKETTDWAIAVRPDNDQIGSPSLGL